MGAHEIRAPSEMNGDAGDASAEAERWNGKGNAYLAVKDYVTASSCFDLALKTNPGSEHEDIYLSNRATAQFRKGNFEAAVEGFRQASQVRPQKNGHLTCLGKVYLRWGGHEEEALEALEQSLRIQYTDVAASLAYKAQAAIKQKQSEASPSPATPRRRARPRDLPRLFVTDASAAPLLAVQDATKRTSSPVVRMSPARVRELLGDDGHGQGGVGVFPIGKQIIPGQRRESDGARRSGGVDTEMRNKKDGSGDSSSEKGSPTFPSKVAGFGDDGDTDSISSFVRNKAFLDLSKRGEGGDGNAPEDSGQREMGGDISDPQVNAQVEQGALAGSSHWTTSSPARREHTPRAGKISVGIVTPVSVKRLRQRQHSRESISSIESVGSMGIVGGDRAAPAARQDVAATGAGIVARAVARVENGETDQTEKEIEPTKMVKKIPVESFTAWTELVVAPKTDGARLGQPPRPKLPHVRRPSTSSSDPRDDAGVRQSGRGIEETQEENFGGGRAEGVVYQHKVDCRKQQTTEPSKPSTVAPDPRLLVYDNPAVSQSGWPAGPGKLSYPPAAEGVRGPPLTAAVADIPVLAQGDRHWRSEKGRVVNTTQSGTSGGGSVGRRSPSSPLSGEKDLRKDDDVSASGGDTGSTGGTSALDAQRSNSNKPSSTNEAEQEAWRTTSVPSAVALAAIAAAAAPVKWGKERAEERRAAAAAMSDRDGLTDLWPFEKKLRRRGSRVSEISTGTSIMSSYSSSVRGSCSLLSHVGIWASGGGTSSDHTPEGVVCDNYRYSPIQIKKVQGREGEHLGLVKLSPTSAQATEMVLRGDGDEQVFGEGYRPAASWESSLEAFRRDEDRRPRTGGLPRELIRSEKPLGGVRLERVRIKSEEASGALTAYSGGDGDDGQDSGGGRKEHDHSSGEEHHRGHSRRRTDGSTFFYDSRRLYGGGELRRNTSEHKLRPHSPSTVVTRWRQDLEQKRREQVQSVAKMELFLNNEQGEWGQTPACGRFSRLRWPRRSRHVPIGVCLDSPKLAQRSSISQEEESAPFAWINDEEGVRQIYYDAFSTEDSTFEVDPCVFFSQGDEYPRTEYASGEHRHQHLRHNSVPSQVNRIADGGGKARDSGVGQQFAATADVDHSYEGSESLCSGASSSRRSSGTDLSFSFRGVGTGGRKVKGTGSKTRLRRRWSKRKSWRIGGGGGNDAVPSEESVERWIRLVLGPRALGLVESDGDMDGDENIHDGVAGYRRGLAEKLKDGRLLVRLAHAVGGKRTAGMAEDLEATTPMLQLVNVHAFMAAARAIGVPADSLFNPKDLVDGPPGGLCSPAVLKCLAALSDAVRKNSAVDSHDGAYYGPLLGDSQSYHGLVGRGSVNQEMAKLSTGDTITGGDGSGGGHDVENGSIFSELSVC